MISISRIQWIIESLGSKCNRHQHLMLNLWKVNKNKGSDPEMLNQIERGKGEGDVTGKSENPRFGHLAT